MDLMRGVGLANGTVSQRYSTLWMLDTTPCCLPHVCKMETFRSGGFQQTLLSLAVSNELNLESTLCLSCNGWARGGMASGISSPTLTLLLFKLQQLMLVV